MAVSTIDPNGLNVGQLGGDKNIVVNGMFAVSQRGDFTSASSASNSTYYVDRWIAVVTTVTANKQHLLNTTYGNAFLLTATSTGSGRLGIVQRLETQPYMLNTTVTLSCWVKSNNANARLYIYNNVDGMNTSTPHTGDGTWQKLTMSLALTSGWTDFEVSSRIMSSTNTNVSITSGDYIQTAQVQLEVGSTPTVFQNELYLTTLQKCLRYYQVSGSIRGYPMVRYEDTGNGKAYSNWRLIPEMRAAPTVSFTGTFVASTGYSGTPTASDITARQFRLLSASSVNPNDNLWIDQTSSDEREGIVSDAEL